MDVLIALGDMASAEKRYDLAEGFYPRALIAAEALRPQDLTRLRNALVHAGMFYAARDGAGEALPILERAAATSEKLPDRELHAIDLDNLGTAHQHLKQYRRAIQLRHEALAIAKQLADPKYPTRGTILHNLGRTYLESGQPAEAEPFLREALAVFSSGGASESWRVKIARKSYAELLRSTGRAEEADKLELL